MNNRTLLTITEDFVELMDFLEGLDDDQANADAAAKAKLDEYIADLKTERETKLDNYAAVIKELEARANMRKTLYLQLKAKADRDEANAKRLKERIKEHFDAIGQKKFEGPRFTIAIQANGGLQALVLNTRFESDPELLPEGFKKIVWQVDTEAIRDALMNGESLSDESGDWASLAPRGTHVRVR